MCYNFNKFLVLSLIINLCLAQEKTSLTLGGLFDDGEDDENYHVFMYSIEQINNQNLNDDDIPTLVAAPFKIKYGDEFEASKVVCDILKDGTAAIFGPSSPDTAHYVQSVCDEKEMPLVQSIWDPKVEIPTINLHPHPDVLGEIILDIIKTYEWTTFTILYESAQWLPRISNLLKYYDAKGYTITVRQLTAEPTFEYRKILKRLKDSLDERIVIDCSLEILESVLQQAQQVGLLTNNHKIIVTNLDLHTINLEPYQYSGVNITGIRMIDPEDRMVKDITNFWAERYKEDKQGDTEPGKVEHDNDDDDENENGEKSEDDEDDPEKDLIPPLTASVVRLETALIFDGVLLFVKALEQLAGVEQLQQVQLNCQDSDTWKVGYSIANYMRTSSVMGLTKYIKFDHEGHRKEFELDVIELQEDGIKKVGTWNSTHKLRFIRVTEKPHNFLDDGSMKNISLRVITAISAPYGMLKESTQTLTGNERFEGFGIELIENLAELLGFNFTFSLQDDGEYGNLNAATGKWNGMIGEVLANRADLAITDLTITSEREGAVDFTMPFMNLGISILYRKPSKQPPSFFSFMSPFSNEVWLYLGAAYIGVSLCLFILGRISPNEWDNPYPCVEEPEVLENQFTLRNALWFTIGALLQQGTELAPKTPSTRTIASIWWFFTLIMVSSYTANLAAFLTVESLSSPIYSAKDLADANGEIPYGAKKGGSTWNFFKDADVPIYQKMYDYMNTHQEHLTTSNKEGERRVKTQNYAYLMESTSIEYTVERECEVTQVGGNLDNKGYGIAMRKDFKYRGILSEAVLRLQEQGKLTEMKIKWWKEKCGGGLCSDSSGEGGAVPLGLANTGGIFVLLITGATFAVIFSICECIFTAKKRAKDFQNKGGSESAAELEMSNVGGVFLVLMVGSLFATCIGCCEWFITIYKRAKYYKVPFKKEFMEELRFVIKCHGNTKTVRQRKSASTDSQESGLSNNSNNSRTSITPKGDSKPDPYGFRIDGGKKKSDLNYDS